MEGDNSSVVLDCKCTVECKHIAACANKSTSCVCWGDNGLIAIGNGESVAICEKRSTGDGRAFRSISKTLNGHKGRVNCVKWIKNHRRRGGLSYLLSGSTDKTILVWQCESDHKFDVINILKGHDGAITSLAGIIFDDSNSGACIIVSSAVDSMLKIWGNYELSDPADAILLQSINLSPSLGLTISLHLLNNEIPVLACGLDNSKVNLYLVKDSDPSDKSVITREFGFILSLSGHEDWVRGIDFVPQEKGDFLLATCSQDSFIRLWRIAPQIHDNHNDSKSDILKVKEVEFTTRKNHLDTKYVVILDAVLSGHEGWVYSVNWSKDHDGGLKLLSASMDKSVIVWRIDEESGIWLEEARFGEVGGNTLGFYGAQFNPCGSAVVAHSYNGALHLWEKENGPKGESLRWNAGVVASGHFGSVLDLSWEPIYGRYFVTTGSDQTTRLFGTWCCKGQSSWHEIARPQVHGYDMTCISMVDSFRFISGADEKVLRVFEAPANFVQNFESLNGEKLPKSSAGPEGATVPALGLSNKAVFSNEVASEKETPTSRGEQYIENQFRKHLLIQPPSEEHLLQNSLWPETHKLYWHVFEIFCVAASLDGKLVASAAKSATPQHSVIVLWDTKTWKEVAQLPGHVLTVTQLEFSHDGRFLLSVSRDRTWILHKITQDADSQYTASTFARSEKKTCHSRIIWSATWTHDGRYFATGSRDKKVMLWKIEATGPDQGAVDRVLVQNFTESITAVSFATRCVLSSTYLLAVGKESGKLELYIFSSTPNFACELLHKFDNHESHAVSVKRLKWRPQQEDTNEHWLASCSEDRTVKLFAIKVT